MKQSLIMTLVIGAMLIGVPAASGKGIGSGYPVSGTVSQGHNTVGLGYRLGVCGPRVAGEKVVCPAIAGYAGVHRIKIRTPGAVHIRLSVAARVIKAGDQSIKGTVKQVDPTHATITFPKQLPVVHRSGLGGLEEDAWVTVELVGHQYTFYFEPIQKHG